MSVTTKPVSDSVPMINNEVAVGEDLDFQRRWWTFERAVWIFFALLVVLDLAGVFGRGPAAKAHINVADGSMQVDYERVERFLTPSILSVSFAQSSIHDGKVQLWVGESLVKKLGNQRVVPQPVVSQVEEGGILYTFTAGKTPAVIDFALSPASPGIGDLKLQVPGSQPANLRIYIVP